MIKVSRDLYNKIVEHSKTAYPNECCGVLAGDFGSGEVKVVTEVHALANLNTERANDRYEVDPAELLKVEKDVASRKLDVLGFYHSHPDHPSEPSQFDRDRGWPDYSYVIIAVEGGEKTWSQSWTFTEMDKPFGEEELQIED
jgi:proteasome lid subunit RPN8/RPN11